MDVCPNKMDAVAGLLRDADLRSLGRALCSNKRARDDLGDACRRAREDLVEMDAEDVVDAVVAAVKKVAVDLGEPISVAAVPYPPDMSKFRRPYRVCGIGLSMSATGDLSHRGQAIEQLEDLEARGAHAFKFTGRLRHLTRVAEELGELLGVDAERRFPGVRRVDGRPLVLFWTPRLSRNHLTGAILPHVDPWDEGQDVVKIEFEALPGAALPGPPGPAV